VHNHGGSPGKRLGVKKFSGMFGTVLTISSNYPSLPQISTLSRETSSSDNAAQYSIQDSMYVFCSLGPYIIPLSFVTGQNGSRPYIICRSAGVRSFLQGKVDAWRKKIRGGCTQPRGGVAPR
jgi:hypothetical protein